MGKIRKVRTSMVTIPNDFHPLLGSVEVCYCCVGKNRDLTPMRNGVKPRIPLDRKCIKCSRKSTYGWYHHEGGFLCRKCHDNIPEHRKYVLEYTKKYNFEHREQFNTYTRNFRLRKKIFRTFGDNKCE